MQANNFTTWTEKCFRNNPTSYLYWADKGTSAISNELSRYTFWFSNPPCSLYPTLCLPLRSFLCVSLWSVCPFVPVCPFERVFCSSLRFSLNHSSICLIFVCLLQLSLFLSVIFLTSTITTITKVTSWRGPKLVHVETATVTNANVGRPQATIISPMETHFSTDNSISCSRVRAIQPTRCMGATSIFSYTGRRHLCSRCTTKSIPSER